MAAEVKFCGLTRREDAAEAARLGARYTGVIFAGGPRRLDPAAARAVLEGASGATARVGVFGADTPGAIADVARALALDVVQLHGDPDAATVDAVRRETGVAVWAVLRVRESLPERADDLFASADGVVLDALVEGALGGTGVALGWEAIAGPVERARAAGRARLVLAGGLRPENVGRAIAVLAPDVVDVSSGVEVAAGIKDHARMRAFAEAVRNGAGRA